MAGLLLFAAFTAPAQSTPERIVKAGGIGSLTIGKNLEVTLVQDPQVHYGVTLNREANETLLFEVQNNSLSVSLKRPVANPYEKVKVTLYVESLDKVVLEPYSYVLNEGIFRVSRMHVYVGGEAQAALRISGKIVPHAYGDASVRMREIGRTHPISKRY